jgi:penicillin amidase
MVSKCNLNKVTSMIALAVLCGICALLLPQWLKLWGALPALDGVVSVDYIRAPVSIVRDEAGVPGIFAANRLDSAFALGFVQSQERFFQMDVLRRLSAGRLSALIGTTGISSDKQAALYSFKELAVQVVNDLPPSHAALLQAYTAGVNQGLQQLTANPIEYALLNTAPELWQPADSILVAYSLFLKLQGQDLQRAINLNYLQSQLPAALVGFLVPETQHANAQAPASNLPDASIIDVRSMPPMPLPPYMLAHNEVGRPSGIGWVMSDRLTNHTTVVTDMNLALSMPNLWFRASQQLQNGKQALTFHGLTIPGLPMFLAGSNGNVAWGLSASASQWGQLHTAKPLDSHKLQRRSTIEVNQGQSIPLDVSFTAQGPVVPLKAHPYEGVWQWTANSAASINLGLFELESATDTAQALERFSQTKFVHFDVFVGDKKGQIGWTLMGTIPQSTCWQRQPECPDLSKAVLAPQQHPRMLNPQKGYISVADLPVFNANTGLLFWPDPQAQPKRVSQTKDQLFVMYRPDPQMAFRALVDNRSRSMVPWQTFILNMLSPQVLAQQPQLQEYRKIVEAWNGEASSDSSGYLLLRAFRDRMAEQVFTPLFQHFTTPAQAFTVADYQTLTHQWEDVLWQIIRAQPDHLLAAPYQSWDELFTAILQESDTHLKGAHQSLMDAHWGQYNRVELTHMLHRLLPWPSREWLSIPRSAGSGDISLAKAQLGNFGASLRFVISPGQETASLISMPIGQASNPLAPYWLSGHDAWVSETPQAFLPGKPRTTLILNPTHSEQRSDHATKYRTTD